MTMLLFSRFVFASLQLSRKQSQLKKKGKRKENLYQLYETLIPEEQQSRLQNPTNQTNADQDLLRLCPPPGCDMCADNRNGECPMHGPLHSLRRLVGTSSTVAPAALPDVPDWLRDLPREVRRPCAYCFWTCRRDNQPLFTSAAQTCM